MTKKQIEAEAAFAKEVYKDRAKINHRALAALIETRPVTIRVGNREVALAKPNKRSEASDPAITQSVKQGSR